MQIVMELINGARLNYKLRNIASVKDKRAIVRKAARESARPLFAATKAEAPVKTGLLKRAVKLRASKKSRIRVGVNVIIRKLDWASALKKGLVRGKYGPKQEQTASGWWRVGRTYYQTKQDIAEHPKNWKLFYAGFQELGTKKIRAKHFMKRTARKYRNEVINDFMKRCFQLIKDLAK
jgi:HK97 gp10 family phage protein